MARAAQQQFNTAANVAGATGSQLQSEGQAIQSTLTPFLTSELTAQHSMSPEQLNQLLTSAGAGAGGATGAFAGQAELEAARTGQGAGASSALMDSLARGRQQAMAKSSEGIAAQDVRGALANRQAAAQQLGAMGQADIGDALKAMGLQTQDISGEVEAGKSGWFQNLTGMISALNKGGGGGNQS